MEYSISKLTKLSGISARTLRYYDEIDLLKPLRVSSSGYRIYGVSQLEKLQQILFYRELGVALDEIKKILSDKDFDKSQALKRHLSQLIQEKARIDLLIFNVTKTIMSDKGEIEMTDSERFEGFKDKLIKENEEKYGSEIRKRYGDKVVEASNEKMKNMPKEQMERAESLSLELEQLLKEAVDLGDPNSDTAQRACHAHKEWICCFWPEGMYTKESHLNLVQMYNCDERFKEYYEKIAVGGCSFLLKAMEIYCS